MADESTIQVKQADGVAWVTFARPKHNVFNIGMIRALSDTLEAVARQDDLKCTVFCGDGPSWCAGVDVGDHKPDMAPEMIDAFNRSLALIEGLEMPTIAAVHGACLGGGMEYAIACDMVIASERATFGQPEVKLGFLPPYAAIRLPRLVGVARAIEICATGKIFTAQEAKGLGFVSRTAAADAFDDAVAQLVKELQTSSPLILKLNKLAVKQHVGMPLVDALPAVSDLFLNRLMKTEDTLEGIASFYEKRRPEWKNR